MNAAKFLLRRLRPALAGMTLLSCVAGSGEACAANITGEAVNDPPGYVISITGAIEQGDLVKFRRLAVAHDKARVVLASPGGDEVEALEMGKIVLIKGFDTVAPQGQDCASACALIWLAGQTKFLAKTGRVGFHASYIEEGGRKQESGVANAIVGAYLAQLHLTENAVVFATSAAPDEINWLTAANAAQVGIPVRAFDGRNPPSADTPQGDEEDVVSYATVGSWQVMVDKTLGNGCFMLANFGDVSLRVGFDTRDTLDAYLLLSGAGWSSIRDGEVYNLELDFTDSPTWRTKGAGMYLGKANGLLVPVEPPRILDRIADHRTLRVRYRGREVASLNLDGGAAALQAVFKCQSEQKKNAPDPFSH